MHDTDYILKGFNPKHDFFIGIDSDGCVFDSMDIKHKECFIPLFIKYFNLNQISKFAAEAWEFVNLHSHSRGCNRFIGLIRSMDLLAVRKEIVFQKNDIMNLDGVREWIKKGIALCNSNLKKEIEHPGAFPDLKIAYNWSIDVNNKIEQKDIIPFQSVGENLINMKNNSDIMVISQTPSEEIIREWKSYGIDIFPAIIAGQEYGGKKNQIFHASNGKYKNEKILMIGDSIGDLEAAKANNVLFFPIIPGKEEECWKLFGDEVLNKFYNLSYKGHYEDQLISQFLMNLPDNPYWEFV
jgi:phosphoglycolate phosphatase-like HAD superfamily hydrolase